jgi:hypothetical protein
VADEEVERDEEAAKGGSEAEDPSAEGPGDFPDSGTLGSKNWHIMNFISLFLE